MLTLAPGLELPLDAVTQPIGIVARRGAGKTTTASVLTEEMVAAGLQVVVLDPQGVWWGLRSSADGTGDGIPITILGGEHGDIPLEETAGKLVADLVIDNPTSSFVLDLTSFESNAAQDRFAHDFAIRLYRGKALQKSPVMLIVDEAESFAPQNPMPNQRAMLGAFEAIVKRGRVRGLGITLITQRLASLSKNVFNQTECLILMQLTGPQDRKAVDDWIKGHGSDEERMAVISSLASMNVGDAWFWSPQWLGVLQRVHIRPRGTFDSSRTPKPGEVMAEPRRLAPVELDVLRDRMAATISKAEANDPAKLRSQLAEMRVKLARAEKAAAVPQTVTQVVEKLVEVPVWPPGAKELVSWVNKYAAEITAADQRFSSSPAAPPTSRSTPVESSSRGPERKVVIAPPPAIDVPVTRRADAPFTLGKAERAILSVLAQYPQGRTKTQVALLTGYASGGGGFNNPLGRLRTAGLITGSQDLAITDAGLGAIAGQVEPLPAPGPALLGYWQAKVGKAGRLILGALAEAYPSSLSKEELAERTGYAAGGGGFLNPLGRLRTLELISGKGELTISPALMESD